MIPLRLSDVAAAVGGHVDGDPTVVISAPATLDSRRVERGGLFVAVAGDRVDGHDYAVDAVAAGAAAVLATRALGVPTVVVADPVEALGLLAAYVLERLSSVLVIALTGSQGKTGTKDYLARVLSDAGPTVATAGNLNNELGVPLTVLRATRDTRYLVLEMGARGVGHIAYLCRIARPRIAAVLNVGSAHVGEFGSVEAIARGKGEIVEALPAEGVAVLNADDPLTRAMAARTSARVLLFGHADDADAVVTEGRLDDLGRPQAQVTWEGRTWPLRLRQVGLHQLDNAVAAMALAIAAGVDPDRVVASLAEAVNPSRWRMELTELRDGIVLVNDAYNANPASTRAALDAVAAIGRRRRARTIAVLGEMRELGDVAPAAHREIGRYAAQHGFDVLVGVGAGGEALLAGLASPDGDQPGGQGSDTVTAGVYAEDRSAALAWLREHLEPGDVVVVKASRAAELERLAAAVVEEYR